jgi:hypothetical protein
MALEPCVHARHAIQPRGQKLFQYEKTWLDGRFVAYIEKELSHYESEIKLEYIEEVSDGA